jgi:hypothetical protein
LWAEIALNEVVTSYGWAPVPGEALDQSMEVGPLGPRVPEPVTCRVNYGERIDAYIE